MSKRRLKRKTGSLTTKYGGEACPPKPNVSKLWKNPRVCQGNMTKLERSRIRLRGAFTRVCLYEPDRVTVKRVDRCLYESQVLAYKIALLVKKYPCQH